MSHAIMCCQCENTVHPVCLCVCDLLWFVFHRFNPYSRKTSLELWPSYLYIITTSDCVYRVQEYCFIVDAYSSIFLYSLRSSDAHMRQSTIPTLVQIMACRLCLMLSYDLNQCWLIVNWTPGNTFRRNLYQHTTTFIQENTSEMSSISSRT